MVVCPGSSEFFGFRVGFVLLSPLQVQFLDRMTGGDQECCQLTFQVRMHLLYHILKDYIPLQGI